MPEHALPCDITCKHTIVCAVVVWYVLLLYFVLLYQTMHSVVGFVMALLRLVLGSFMLFVLYPPTVPEGSGKGTLAAVNGLKATEYLRRAERLTPHSQPFSWVLFRPPWAPNQLCYKACVCNQMKQVCNDASTKVPVYFQVQCSS